LNNQKPFYFLFIVANPAPAIMNDKPVETSQRPLTSFVGQTARARISRQQYGDAAIAKSHTMKLMQIFQQIN
jgi:hypothetical protein